MGVLFVGDDWSEDHHDVEVVDGTGRKLAARRLPEGMAGMQRLRADFTNTFRAFADGASRPDPLFEDDDMIDWQSRWQARLGRQPQSLTEAGTLMRSCNPAVIPRNHRVEEALAAAGEEDYQPLQRLLAVLARPYDDTPEQTFYSSPSPPSAAPTPIHHFDQRPMKGGRPMIDRAPTRKAAKVQG